MWNLTALLNCRWCNHYWRASWHSFDLHKRRSANWWGLCWTWKWRRYWKGIEKTQRTLRSPLHWRYVNILFSNFKIKEIVGWGQTSVVQLIQLIRRSTLLSDAYLVKRCFNQSFSHSPFSVPFQKIWDGVDGQTIRPFEHDDYFHWRGFRPSSRTSVRLF